MEHSGLDLQAMHLFWELTDRLQAGGSVADADWEALWATPGYRTLFKERYTAAQLQPRMTLAFARGREEEARAAAESDLLVAHYLAVREHKSDLQTFCRMLGDTEVFDRGVTAAAQWLPPAFVARGRRPTAAVMVYDAHARGDDPVMIDPLFAYYLGEEHLVLMLGHIFFHNYRAQYYEPIAAWLSDELKPLARLIDNMQNEGMADLVNVERYIFQGGPLYVGGPLGNERWVTRLRQGVEEAPAFLVKLNAVLEAGLADRASAVGQVPDLRASLVISEHGPGYYMARRIVLAGLKEELIESCTNPIRFLELYAEACKRDGHACELSPCAFVFLRSLQ